MAAGLLFLFGSSVKSVASERHIEEPAILTLQVDEADGADVVRGTLTVDLRPGWKTYWLDPGASGIPPTIDFSRTGGIASARIETPLPHRFGEDLARANGFKTAVDFPFEIALAEGHASGTPIVADVFIGVCDEICIPIQARLEAAPSKASRAKVTEAFAKLPELADISGVTVALDNEILHVTRTGDDADNLRDLYVMGPKGWYFGEPEAEEASAGTTRFTVPIEEAPKDGHLPAVDLLFDDGGRGVQIRQVPVARDR
ncbi:MAG: protein-disulfide reductase DsbD domain-containing protein [Pseudomonadota bacterium]|nr:protein-disulfide reductase DsbD domain-containing protein [Pseudomonadota bacterium]